MSYNPKDFCSNGREVDKCRKRLQKYCVGIGLDIGCGSIIEEKGYPLENKIVPHAIGFDKAYTNIRGMADDLHWFKNNTMDFIFSSHLLEHIKDYKKCLKEWWRILAPNGYLILYLPHGDYYPSVNSGIGNPDHKHDFYPLTLMKDFLKMPFTFELIHVQEHNEENEYSFDFVVRKIS